MMQAALASFHSFPHSFIFFCLAIGAADIPAAAGARVAAFAVARLPHRPARAEAPAGVGAAPAAAGGRWKSDRAPWASRCSPPGALPSPPQAPAERHGALKRCGESL